MFHFIVAISNKSSKMVVVTLRGSNSKSGSKSYSKSKSRKSKSGRGRKDGNKYIGGMMVLPSDIMSGYRFYVEDGGRLHRVDAISPKSAAMKYAKIQRAKALKLNRKYKPIHFKVYVRRSPKSENVLIDTNSWRQSAWG